MKTNLNINSKDPVIRLTILLAIFTIAYNFIEGIISIYFGLGDEVLSLFGFGLDSFVEVISGIGILHMIIRIKNNQNENKDQFEKRALQITGTSFYLLTFGLVVSASYNFIYGIHPITTTWGIIVSGVSILVMWWLVREKLKVGKKLNSDAIIADANCTKACLQLSFILLISCIGFELFELKRIDAIGSLIIAYLAFKEGRESFEKSRNQINCCC
jgi:divalent metal cation (Fe/Co/Zn/Cd) transporter